MYSFNINEIIEAVKFSGLLSFNKVDEIELYDKLSYSDEDYDNQSYSY